MTELGNASSKSTGLVARFERWCDRARAAFGRPWAVFALPFLLVLIQITGAPGADPDLFARVAMGRLIETLGSVPLVDPFAFTPKHTEWIDHEWLSGVVFWWLAQTFGDPGFVAFQILMLGLSCVYVARAALLVAPGASGLALWITVCMLEASFAWASVVRCQVFTYLFIPVLFVAYLEHRKFGRVRHLLLLPFIFVVWTNAHGGFALGLVVAGIFTGSALLERKRVLVPLLILALSVAATALNPYGFVRYWEYIIHALSMERPNISEWGPLYSDPAGLLIALTLAAIVVWGMKLKGLQKDLAAVTLLAFSTYCALKAIRLEAFMMETLAVFGAPYSGAAIERFRALAPRRSLVLERSAGAVASVVVIGAVLTVAILFLTLPATKLNLSAYPLHATHWIRTTQPSGSRVLVDFNSGSFAHWRLYPHALISMDGRYEEVYPPETAKLNAEALKLGTPESDRALTKLSPTHIILPVKAAANNKVDAISDEWSVQYQDSKFLVLVRQGIEVTANTHTEEPPYIWKPLF